MKTFMNLTLGLLTGFLISLPAMAQTTSGYDCSLDGTIHGASIGFVISGEVLSGVGTLSCRDLDTGRMKHKDVKMKLVGAGVGFDFTVIRALRLHAAGVQAARGFDDFKRSFDVGANAGVTVLSDGVNVDTALQVNKNGFGFTLGLIGEDAIGLGVRLQGMVFTITPI